MGIIVLVLLTLLVIGLPIGIAFALSALLGGQLLDIPLSSFASLSNQAVTSFPLLAIPLFILAGQIMNQGSIVKQLVDLSERILAKVHGSLGYVTVLASAFLGAITGSSVATVSAIGSSVGKKMQEMGYNRGYTASLIAAAGLLGVFIPPSIPLILYGATVGTSIASLFIASIVPGILFVIAYLILHRILLKKVYNPSNSVVVEEDVHTSTQPFSKLFLKSIPALIMPVIVLGGIYSGIFTPTEAAAVACFYGLALAVLTRKISIKNLFTPFKIAAISSAAILGIIAFSNLFNYMITLEQIPQAISEMAINVTDNKYIFILLLIGVLFIVGMFMETNAAVLLMAVLFGPAAIDFGINPIHFGIILVTTIEIGLLTPPMAANVFVSAKVNNSSVIEMMPHTMKFLLVSIIVLLVVAFVPFLTTWFL